MSLNALLTNSKATTCICRQIQQVGILQSEHCTEKAIERLSTYVCVLLHSNNSPFLEQTTNRGGIALVCGIVTLL